MDKIIQKTKNKSPNLEFYKTISDKGDIYKKYNDFYLSEPFDVYKMESKETNEQNFLGGYIATSNIETKNIDIYKIYSKDNIKLIYTIALGYKSINKIKYFYDSFHNIHYLTALIDDKSNILIWKIKSEIEYDLIFNYQKIVSQGGYSMSRRPIMYSFYMLLFNKENSLLIMIYNIQRGCCRRDTIIEKFDFINNQTLNSCSMMNRYYESFFKGISINIDGNDYLGILTANDFILYNIFSEEFQNNKKEINIIKGADCSEFIRNGINIKENDKEDYLYYNIYYHDNDYIKNYMFKTNIKTNENLFFQFDLGINKPITMIQWNKKYLLLFELYGENIFLFNTKTFRIEKILDNDNGSVFGGKKLLINDNEELLFIMTTDGNIDLWINKISN